MPKLSSRSVTSSGVRVSACGLRASSEFAPCFSTRAPPFDRKVGRDLRPNRQGTALATGHELPPHCESFQLGCSSHGPTRQTKYSSHPSLRSTGILFGRRITWRNSFARTFHSSRRHPRKIDRSF